MGLKVWLPLDGSLENKGVDKITFNGVTPVFGTAGKIGANGLDIYATPQIKVNIPSLTNAQKFSFAFWYKPRSNANVTSNWQAVFTLDDANTSDGVGRLRIESSYGSVASTYAISIHNNSHYGIASVGYSFTSEWDNWHHIAFTCDGNKCRGYHNGVLVKEENFLGGKLRGAGYIGSPLANSGADGLMNDLRIYDHCLSAAEVHEIAMGLVLHYKLDQPSNLNNNLYIGTRNFTGTDWVNGSAWTTSSETYQGFTVKQRSASWGGLAQNIPCSVNDVFTISFWAKVEEGGTIESIHRSNLGNVTTGLTILNGNFSNSVFWVNTNENGIQWKRYWATVRINSSDITYLQWRIENRTSGKNLYIAGIKLEKGEAPSLWSLSSSEAGETNIIQDSSGYSHNGAVIGETQCVLDTPRYNLCAHFSNTAHKIFINNFPTSGFANSYSFAWWAKISSTSPMHWGFADGNRLNGLYTGRLWNTGDGSNNPLYVPGTTTQVTAPTVNVWHHWVMSGDGTTCKVYQDGELWGVAKTYKSINGTQIYINGWANSTAYSSDNYSISDFRIYCTALPDTDIKSLYNLGMKVDNSQNLHAFEIEELSKNYIEIGENWLNRSGTTNGINWTFNSDGTITLNGTNSLSSNFILIWNFYDSTITSTYNGNDAIKHIPNGTYTIYTGHPKLLLQVFGSNVEGNTYTAIQAGDSTTAILTIDDTYKYNWVRLLIRSGASFNNFTFYPTIILNENISLNKYSFKGNFRENQKASFYKNKITEANEFIEI